MPARLVAFVLAALVTCATALTAPLVTRSRPAGAAPEPELRVGVGRADITPPTGYFTMGNVRSDARAKGQHTRLQARAIVLERGAQKVVLVVTDLCCMAGGLLTEAAEQLKGRVIDETTMVVAATHTHSAPGQYFPFVGHDVTFPNLHTATAFSVRPDPQLYAFLARRLATAIARADDDLAPGAVAWGHTRISEGLTQNRSIEAHLANYGIQRELGEGDASQSPNGVESTIDPALDVLRVDKRIAGRMVPVGMWSSFANHGTVNLGSMAENYNGDHLGAAMLATEDALRRSGGAPPGQEVVSAFSNADEGDTSSALHRTGPAAAEYVGRVEAAAMMRAWRDAGQRLTSTPVLDHRWTRFCFCGQETDRGAVDDKAVPGLPLLSGSEEHRGQLHEHTGVVFEGRRLPAEAGPQGNKIQLLPHGAPIPQGAPLALVRVGDGAIVSNPGEVTVEVGRRLKSAVREAMTGTGLDSVAVSGLANEYQGYFTTPEEYAWQAYEGGQTNFGKFSADLLVQQTGLLAESLAAGRPAPAPYAFDPTNGLEPDDTPYPDGPGAAAVVSQPRGTDRLQRSVFSWRGGPRGVDRPLDRAFVTVQRKGPAGWEPVHDDLGSTIAWEVEGDEQVPLGPGYAKEASEGTYRARWEVPLNARPGVHRFVVTAKKYRIASQPFDVRTGRVVTVSPVRAAADRAAFTLTYPRPEPYEDLTYRPRVASDGQATVRVDGRMITLAAQPDGTFVFDAPTGARVVVPVGAARDQFGNRNGARVTFVAGEPTERRPREPYPVLSPY